MKLSDFKGEKAIQTIGKLLIPITAIAANEEVRKASNKGVAAMLSAALINEPRSVREMLAILHDKPVEEYECDGAVVLADVFAMFSDEALLALFGLQG